MIRYLTKQEKEYMEKNFNKVYIFSCSHTDSRLTKYSGITQPFDPNKKNRYVYFEMPCISCKEKITKQANITKLKKRLNRGINKLSPQ